MLICKIVGKISGGEVGQIGLSSDTDRVADSEEKLFRMVSKFVNGGNLK